MKSINVFFNGGAISKLNKDINKFYTNTSFTIIVCIILALFSARVSQNYQLPSGLYYLVDNIFSKLIFIFIVIFVLQYNVKIGLMIGLSYVLLLISYNNQNKIEKFQDFYVENFTNKEETEEEIKKENEEELNKLIETEKQAEQEVEQNILIEE